MLTAAQIIDKLGGAAAMASALNIPLTTIASWGAANFIPEWRQPAVLEMALRTDKDISATDFPTIAQRVPRKQQAAA